MHTLFENIEPYASGYLEAGQHKIYYEECGNPDGKPAIFLHGGPGGGGSTKVRGFFNPELFRIVIFDQRGCGRSKPHACIENNTTWDLVNDIERIKEDSKYWSDYNNHYLSPTEAKAYGVIDQILER